MYKSEDLLQQFWNVFVSKGPVAATKFCNFYSNGLAVPTFLKFRIPSNKTHPKISYVCINIQEFLRPKHIEGLKLGCEKGLNDPRTANIWYRLMREANLTLSDDKFPHIDPKKLEITFNEVKCLKRGDSGPVEMLSGYIIFDYS